MNFKTMHEARKYFRQYYHCFDHKDIPFYWDEIDKYDFKFGDFIVIQHINNDGDFPMISRPIFGLIVGHTVWDQALVLEFVEQWRSFHYNNEVDDEYISSLGQEVQHIQFWTDNIKVLGHWKSKPTFKQLLKLYRDEFKHDRTITK